MSEHEVIHLSHLAETSADRRVGLARDVLRGLSQHPKALSSKYLYDAAGAELFQRITTLDEYYLTRCEEEILERHGAELALGLPAGRCNVVDLGAGDGHKAHLLLDGLLRAGREPRYVAVDICADAVDDACDGVRRRFPGLPVLGLVGEHAPGLAFLEQDERNHLVLFLGSSIGNYSPPEAVALLAELRNSMRGGDRALIGFDLRKDIDLLMRAYNDARGVTAEFNLNLLRRLNRELGANFDTRRWRHFGTYNPRLGAMESFLMSTAPQQVELAALERSFAFAAWEPIHTEQSHKFELEQIRQLGIEAGFDSEEAFLDRRGFFADVLWRPG